MWPILILGAVWWMWRKTWRLGALLWLYYYLLDLTQHITTFGL